MIQNYFKIAWRNLKRNKIFSLINIVGLTVGLTCCLLLVLYIQHETSFDDFHKNRDRIARVIMQYSMNGGKLDAGNFTSTYVLPRFKSRFSEVESGVRLFSSGNAVKYNEKLFAEDNILYTDSTFFYVFSFPLISGDVNRVLELPKSIVLTESTARKYFGTENPVGKTILIGSKQIPFLITGVAKDCPANSQLKFDFVASFSSLGIADNPRYFNANYTTYLLLKNKNSIASLQSKIEPFMKEELKNEKGVYINYILEPLTKVHLHSPYDALTPNVNIVYIYIIAGVALLVLLIACFTYINLSTVKSMERAKEVGIRKVAGAYKPQIFWQFIGESFVITFAALIISIALTTLLLPAFNSFAKIEVAFSNLLHPLVIASASILVIVIALLAGSYPALIVSGFRPVKVLKGVIKNTASGTWLRKSLIVFQFAISVFLVIATIVIQQQLSYIQRKNLGYDKEHVLATYIPSSLSDKIDLLRTELKSNPNVISLSQTFNSPVNIIGGYDMRRSDMPQTNTMNVKANPIDEEYIKTCGLELIAGNDLIKQDVIDASKDTNSYSHFILNESACKALGWSTPQEAINKKMFLGDGRPGEVKGVVKDFHFASLHSPIEPLVLFPGSWTNTLLIKISGNNLTQTIDFIGKKYKELEPNLPFQYHFMDEDYQKLYSSEMQTAKVFRLFSMIAIVLAALGLFGLSAYEIRQRIKEIGVRKVLGASVTQIVLILSGSFFKLVLTAILIAIPIAWWASQKWLQGFAYRIYVSWWMFAMAALFIVFIALITVCFQAVKAALTNPVKSLRTE